MVTIPKLLIIGASARAAAHSAIQAGYAVEAADFFADADLKRLCSIRKIRDYRELTKVFATSQADFWLFTGALENRTDLLAKWCSKNRLLGCSVESIREVRNPDKIYQAFQNRGLNAARIWTTLPDDGTKLIRKPKSSGGGSRISFANRSQVPSDEFYLQEYMDGQSVSAIFVSTGTKAHLVGVTQQLTGTPWCHARPFQYSGSIGPVRVTSDQSHAWTEIGQCLVSEFQLMGLFGVDAIVNQHGVWPVEVNPRYTASVEVLESSFQRSLMPYHVDACLGRLELKTPFSTYEAPGNVCGKAVLFAPEDVFISKKINRELLSIHLGKDRICADIPESGWIHSGCPVLTAFARGRSTNEVWIRLKENVESLQATLDWDPRKFSALPSC